MAHSTSYEHEAHALTPPVRQAYEILHWGYVAAPAIAGLDKFTDVLVNWDKYLAPSFALRVPMSTHQFMMLAGVIEIFAAFLVAIRPKVGASIVAMWLAGIIVNLLAMGGYYDIALRDFGLMLGAIALARLAVDHEHAVG